MNYLSTLTKTVIGKFRKNSSVQKTKVKEGQVKFFNTTKGFGFIKPADSKDQELFVHKSGLIDRIRQNDKVRYEVAQGRNGLNAIKVELIS